MSISALNLGSASAYTDIMAVLLCLSVGLCCYLLYRLHQIKTARTLKDEQNTCLPSQKCIDNCAQHAKNCRYSSCSALVEHNDNKALALSRLAGGLAHDYNNILSIIEGYVRLMAQDQKNNKAIQDYATKVQNAVKRGTNLTHKMSVFSRHQAEVNRTVDLYDLAQIYQRKLTQTLDEHIKFTIDCDEKAHFYVRSCNDAIDEILDALIHNALEAIGNQNGMLSISMEHVNLNDHPQLRMFIDKDSDKHKDQNQNQPASNEIKNYMCLSIKDTGCGIHDDHKDCIFDPFFTTKNLDGHSGLGLSVVYGLVKQLNGYVCIRPLSKEANPIGTCVDVFLPLCEEEAIQKTTGNIHDPSQIKLYGYSALIVDDEEDLLQILKQQLENIGLHVLTARSMNEALAMHEDYSGTLDFLLTDINMPGGNGADLARMIQATNPSIQIIYMSGFPDQISTDITPIANHIPFMMKPINFDDLAIILHCFSTHTAIKDQTLSQSTAWKETAHG